MENSESLAKARERRIELQGAIARLENSLSMASSGDRWRPSVRESLTGLRAAIDAHIAEVERPDGLLDDIAGDAPRLSNEVELIKREHARLLVDTDAIISDLAEAQAGDLRERAIELLRDLVVHRQRGADLVYGAYATDIGGQG